MLVVLLGHLSVQDELLVERVAQDDFRRQSRRRLGDSIVLDKGHRVFRQCCLTDASHWSARRSAKDGLWSTLGAGSPIDSRGLPHHRVELVLDVLDDSRSDRVLHLFGEDASLVVVVLEAHLGDLIRDTFLFEVL